MIKLLNNDRGFTLVEFIIAIAITGIIAGTIATYLTVHFKSFEFTKDKTDVQYEAQIVMNTITRYGIEAAGLKAIADSTGDCMDKKTDIEPNLFVFISEGKTHVFTYGIKTGDTKKKLYYGKNIGYSGSLTGIIGNSQLLSDDVIGLKIYPKKTKKEIPDPSNPLSTIISDVSWKFKDSNNIEFEISFKEGDVTHTARTQLTFRNKK